ncbi:MAG: hypothetical protein J0L99_22085 [Chitinophagales bacterium]|nr:hypothetical protein [Chitinophagales bacterium]
MTNFKRLFLFILTAGALSLGSCLHIVEEVTMKKSGKGSYKLTLDMSEVKGMLDMVKAMTPDSVKTTEGEENPSDMSQLGREMANVADVLKGVDGISNVKENNDTTSFVFGYSFDFASVDALNNALRMIGKDKYSDSGETVYKFDGKNFERIAVNDLTQELKKAMGETQAEGDEESADMMKMFFADMSYKQIYNFPDQEIKKNSNELGVVSEDKHSITLDLKPFDESQKKATIATQLKLK